ncbi:MAG: hypothetical protein ACRDLD_02395 [Thermoleophilaceae bacterium]
MQKKLATHTKQTNHKLRAASQDLASQMASIRACQKQLMDVWRAFAIDLLAEINRLQDDLKKAEARTQQAEDELREYVKGGERRASREGAS